MKKNRVATLTSAQKVMRQGGKPIPKDSNGAWEHGFDAGREVGLRDAAYEAGHDEGYDEGYDAGYRARGLKR